MKHLRLKQGATSGVLFVSFFIAVWTWAETGSPASGENAADPIARPWTHQNFEHQQNDFSFAVVSDLTCCYREGVFDVAVAQLNLMRPKLVMSVGDLIEGPVVARDGKGVPNPQSTREQWDAFDRMVDRLVMPFYYTPGNHDINSLETKAIWKERYGRPYYHFLYNDCLFLVLNNEDYTRKEFAQMVHNQQLGLKQDPAYLKAWEHYLATIQPGPRIYPRPRPGDLVAGTGNTAALSAEQLAYFENALRENPDVRWTFVFMHQPLWSGGGAQSWQALESLLLDRPYTAFAGHEHTYQYNEVNDRIHIRLGTTGGGMGATGFDHFLWVTLTRDGPVFANLVLDGVLDQYGRIPAGGENLEFRK